MASLKKSNSRKEAARKALQLLRKSLSGKIKNINNDDIIINSALGNSFCAVV